MAQTAVTWCVSVLRRLFNTTAMEQLEDASDEDWKHKLKVEFIGEEGIDEGGLSREFFSLLFRISPCFDGNTFSFSSELLKKGHYRLLGKCVAYALALGHPGPRRLQSNVVDYVLQQNKGSFSEAVILNTEMEQVINQVDIFFQIKYYHSYGRKYSYCSYILLKKNQGRHWTTNECFGYLASNVIPIVSNFIIQRKIVAVNKHEFKTTILGWGAHHRDCKWCYLCNH